MPARAGTHQVYICNALQLVVIVNLTHANDNVKVSPNFI